MKKYPKMKPSGVEWIGEVPEHWEVKKLKYVLNIKSGDGLASEKIDVEGTYPIYGGNGIMGFTEDFNSNNADIIIGRVGAKCGNVRLVYGKKWISDNALLASVNQENDLEFITLLLESMNLNSLSNQSAQPLITGSLIKDKIVALPKSVTEQTAIAAYLDRKTAQIDQAIAEKERLIELFREERQAIINHAVTKGIRSGAKMKSSGVEWIGDVPEGWEVKRLKHVADIFGRIGFRGYTVNDIVEEGQGVITLSPGNIKNDSLTLDTAAYLSFEKYYESPEIMIFPEDIVLVKTGSTIGKTAIIPQNTPEMTLNPQLVVLKDLKVLPKFLYYQTTCPFFKNMFEVEQTGGTTPTISQEKINSFPVVVPPQIEEQKEVVNFIDQKTAQIDTAISGIRQEIALLQEYRQALIFEAVTGKIMV